MKDRLTLRSTPRKELFKRADVPAPSPEARDALIGSLATEMALAADEASASITTTTTTASVTTATTGALLGSSPGSAPTLATSANTASTNATGATNATNATSTSNATNAASTSNATNATSGGASSTAPWLANRPVYRARQQKRCPPTPSPVRVKRSAAARARYAAVGSSGSSAVPGDGGGVAHEAQARSDDEEEAASESLGAARVATNLFSGERSAAERAAAAAAAARAAAAAAAHVNPFSPDRRRHTVAGATASALRAGSDGGGALSRPRYRSDFEELSVLGRGVTSVVYKARNRVDDWTYAVKVKAGGPHGAVSRSSLNEMFALAALASHPNVIRYYQAWVEDARLYLQCEFCAGGSVAQRVNAGAVFDEPELLVFLRQLASALAHIHAHKLVHLDVKPENIFIARGGPAPVVVDPRDRLSHAGTLYKLGDLGLINAASEKESFEDGDSRYFPAELLNAEAQPSAIDLPRADIFALGASVLELARRSDLPPRDEEWHELRRGNFSLPDRLSRQLDVLVHQLMDPVVSSRPSAEELLKHQLLATDEEKRVAQLERRVAELEREVTLAHQQKKRQKNSP